MGGSGGGGGITDWMNPKTSIKGLFTKEGAFGLDMLNVSGVNKDRSMFSAPGTTDLRDAREAVDSVSAANAKAISDAKAAQELAGSQAMASVTNKKRAIARSRSVYTSPLGLGEQANVAKKTLLGA
jgi:hypothetical protein